MEPPFQHVRAKALSDLCRASVALHASLHAASIHRFNEREPVQLPCVPASLKFTAAAPLPLTVWSFCRPWGPSEKQGAAPGVEIQRVPPKSKCCTEEQVMPPKSAPGDTEEQRSWVPRHRRASALGHVLLIWEVLRVMHFVDRLGHQANAFAALMDVLQGEIVESSN